jgi:hypothetical protein
MNLIWLLLVIAIVLLLFSGGTHLGYLGSPAYRTYGYYGGGLGLLLVIVLVILLLRGGL